MYCCHCGKELLDDSVICPYCGCHTSNFKNNREYKDKKSFWFGVLGFFFPVVGLILYLCWMPNCPNRAKSVGRGALICALVFALFYIYFALLCFGVISCSIFC